MVLKFYYNTISLFLLFILNVHFYMSHSYPNKLEPNSHTHNEKEGREIWERVLFKCVCMLYCACVCVCVCKRKRGNPKDDSYVIEDNNKEEVNNKGEE